MSERITLYPIGFAHIPSQWLISGSDADFHPAFIPCITGSAAPVYTICPFPYAATTKKHQQFFNFF